jgi:hypothetical protein
VRTIESSGPSSPRVGTFLAGAVFAMFVGLMLDTWLARPLLVPALVSLFGGSAPEQAEVSPRREEPTPVT